jgi:hypothetical protein
MPTSPSEPTLRPDPESLHGRLLWEARVERIESRVRLLEDGTIELGKRLVALEAVEEAAA